MIVYIDAEYKCHASHIAGTTAAESEFFDEKCAEFVEGYRFVPHGMTWVREDGIAFEGEMVTPWKSFAELDAAQREYERELAAAARILLGEVTA